MPPVLSLYPIYTVLGLNMKKYKDELPPVLHAVEDGKIDKPIFGIFIQNGDRKGEISFGGSNDAHLKRDTAVSVNIEGRGKFLIKMKKLMLGDTEACKAEDASCKAYIDTGCSSIKGPKAVIDQFLDEKLG